MAASGILFDEPQAKPLSSFGVPMPGAYYLFFFTGGLVPAPVYSNGTLATQLSQTPGQAQPSCTADANGRFNPIYMNPANTYRVQLYNSSAQLLEDVDPYVVPASIAALAGQTGSGTLTLGDGVNSTTVNYGYTLSNGNTVCTLQISSGVITSGATNLVVNTLPPAIVPTSGTYYISVPIENGSAYSTGIAQVGFSNGTITLWPNGAGASTWTGSGTKGIPVGMTLVYPLAGIVEH